MSEIVDITGDGYGCLVQGDLRLLRTQRSILAKGGLRTEVELTCGRCLTLFRCPLSLTIEEEYIPVVDVISGAPLPPPEDASSFTIDGHHILDLTEAIRQYTTLAIPMKPLCHEDCAGLCQNCGHNFNQGPCDCPAPAIDPRWSELIKLL
ncbi:DUF177 domain-containing protein [Chloroflexota bacterium]